uniref:Uncharacterized protein n=1 Tax=Lactuca sativa TaxID=4236 RepID=A0A9R1VDJ9_LACSA|nr:hypothetical protein LSAT_V11C500240950 [Lactuca sativa]
MEQLKELEQVQNIMLMIQSTGAIDSSNNTNADSNRFLANFILFMVLLSPFFNFASSTLKHYMLTVIEISSYNGFEFLDLAFDEAHEIFGSKIKYEFVIVIELIVMTKDEASLIIACSLASVLFSGCYRNKMQPCGELDMNQKCKLISNHFPKISSAFNKESSPQLCDKGNIVTEASLSHHCDDDMSVGLLQTDCADVAMVTLDSMQRANSTLQDFCRSYFMFHEMDANNAESIFKYLPLLSFTESYIYQLDTINEKLLQLPSDGIPDSDMMTPDWILRFIKSFKNDTFKPLAVLLESYGIYTDRIRDELKCGEEYWALERKLCSALTNKQEVRCVIPMELEFMIPFLEMEFNSFEFHIQIEDVMRAIHLKSFDYRVLNLLLYQLNGKDINETHMEFLSVSEFLVEVSDDLFDYEDDVLENNFNILRMFVRIHGASSAPAFLLSFSCNQAKTIIEAEKKYNSLLNTLDPQLSFKYQKRCEEATKEGGKVFGPPLGTWSIPPIIEDEDLYRTNSV